jgi:hypothetical protein
MEEAVLTGTRPGLVDQAQGESGPGYETRRSGVRQTGRQTHRALIAGLLFPGAGQAVQKRYLAAAGWAGGFVVSCGFFFWESGRVIAGFYRFALNFETASPPEVAPLTLVLSFTAAMVVYILSLIDVQVHSRRRA